MPILQNAKKALRVAKRKAEVNQPVRSRLKTTVDASKKSSTLENMSRAFSAIDKAVKRHIIHRKKAARMKSQLAQVAAKDTTKTDAQPVTQAAKKPVVKKPAAKKTAK